MTVKIQEQRHIDSKDDISSNAKNKTIDDDKQTVTYINYVIMIVVILIVISVLRPAVIVIGSPFLFCVAFICYYYYHHDYY